MVAKAFYNLEVWADTFYNLECVTLFQFWDDTRAHAHTQHLDHQMESENNVKREKLQKIVQISKQQRWTAKGEEMEWKWPKLFFIQWGRIWSNISKTWCVSWRDIKITLLDDLSLNYPPSLWERLAKFGSWSQTCSLPKDVQVQRKRCQYITAPGSSTTRGQQWIQIWLVFCEKVGVRKPHIEDDRNWLTGGEIC